MPEPTKQQIDAFTMAIGMTAEAPENHHAEVVAEMDDDGTMLVSLTEDGLRLTARFDKEGDRVGDWS